MRKLTWLKEQHLAPDLSLISLGDTSIEKLFDISETKKNTFRLKSADGQKDWVSNKIENWTI